MEHRNYTQFSDDPMIAMANADREIDAEHQSLLRLLSAAKSLCGGDLKLDCHGCEIAKRNDCVQFVMRHMGDVLGFMADHFAHEERLMRYLPQSLGATDHCERHRVAHAEISEALVGQVTRLDESNPARSNARLCGLIEDWLSDHIANDDHTLLGYFAAAAAVRT